MGTLNKHMKRGSFQLVTRRHNSAERLIFHTFIGEILTAVFSVGQGAGVWVCVWGSCGALLMGCQSSEPLPRSRGNVYQAAL